MNDIFHDSDIEVPDITKKNWASVATALKKHNDDMSALKKELHNLGNQFNSLAGKFTMMEQQHREALARSFDGGPTAEN